MKTNEKGFSLVEVLIVIVVVGLLGAFSWLIAERQTLSNAPSSDVSVGIQNSGGESKAVESKKFVVPTGWVNYENSAEKVKFAYPEIWNTSLGFAQGFDIVKETNAVVYQGCGDPACSASYDPKINKWAGTNVLEDIKPVLTKDSKDAYLIPLKGEMYCGLYGLYIHLDNRFIVGRLSLCSKNDDPNFQPKESVFSFEGVVDNLPKVFESIETGGSN